MLSYYLCRPYAKAWCTDSAGSILQDALAPFAEPGTAAFPWAAAIRQLRLDVAVVVSAEALFLLTDLCGLSAEEAIASATRTAATLTGAPFAG